MGHYQPVVAWQGQTCTVNAHCLTCDWKADEVSIAAVRLHAIGHRRHVVQLYAVTTTLLRRLSDVEAADVQT